MSLDILSAALLILAPTNQDGDGHNAKLKALKRQSTMGDITLGLHLVFGHKPKFWLNSFPAPDVFNSTPEIWTSRGAKEKVRRSPRSLRFIVQEWMSSQKTTNPSRRCGDISLTKSKNVILTMALEEMSPSQRASSPGTMNVNARFSGNSSQSWQNNVMDQPNVKLRLWVNLNSPHFCKKNRNHLPLFLPPCSRIIFIHSPPKNFPLSNTHCKLSLAATEVSASQGKKKIYLSIHINRCNVNCGRLFFRV